MENIENIITIKNLNFSYPDGHHVLTDVNLEIRKGEIFGIIGPTGAGKSTLLQHLNGILKGEGEIVVDGLKIEKKNDMKIKQRVGIVFQNPDDQLFCPTVNEDIAFGLFNLGFKAGEIDEKVHDILEKMGLSHLSALSSHHLSFGEKKRVALATTLVMNPQVIALDEPFANLDYKSLLTVIEIIETLPLTRIIISQDILLALSLCQRIAILANGKIIKVGMSEEIAGDHAGLSECGLDYLPYLRMIKKYL